MDQRSGTNHTNGTDQVTDMNDAGQGVDHLSVTDDGTGGGAGTGLREWLAGALSEACDGEISAQEILGARCSFVALGVGSLSMVRLIDVIESGLDVEIEFEGDAWFMEDLDSLVTYLSGLSPRETNGLPLP
ncbi:hypothetical protein [Sphaerisporangium corydalis]|uniref:Carrier domain-containing protein n=1 Tax=Sphaerisporangium corydalis TaxID=1441875 RepID=A0ABV9E5S5_9ACTN|nr:hypothetical protein [Sphaerisporangium corydalis]